MRKVKVPSAPAYLVLLLLTLTSGLAVGQNKVRSTAAGPDSAFELKNGERVVFLGNSLFENDLPYGYLELALTTRWPDREVTFRNLGWTGDNVFGDARNEITNPPTAYQMLMEQITKAQPTLVFIGYGGIEAQEGEAGLARFREGLGKLIDKIDQLGSKSILLSPIPVMTDSALNPAKQNAMLRRYATAISELAAQRGKRYIDIFEPILEVSKKASVTDNGIHLNETGYYHLTAILEKKLGLEPRNKPVRIAVSKNAAEASAPVQIVNYSRENPVLTFKIEENCLPLPVPVESRGQSEEEPLLRISGLKKGFYTLTADGTVVLTASAENWEKGVPIRQGVFLNQIDQLREFIMKKNELFFFQYRPLNRTYILGFRSYEQGRHVKGLEEQNILITWLEGQIASNRRPKPRIYQLTPLK